jgi:hypothetical protein
MAIILLPTPLPGLTCAFFLGVNTPGRALSITHKLRTDDDTELDIDETC